MNENQFLNLVYEYVKEHPDVAAKVTEKANIGLSEALAELRHQASDFESCAFQLVMPDHMQKGKTRAKVLAREFLEQKLTIWKEKLFLKWDWYLEKKNEI